MTLSEETNNFTDGNQFLYVARGLNKVHNDFKEFIDRNSSQVEGERFVMLPDGVAPRKDQYLDYLQQYFTQLLKHVRAITFEEQKSVLAKMAEDCHLEQPTGKWARELETNSEFSDSLEFIFPGLVTLIHGIGKLNKLIKSEEYVRKGAFLKYLATQYVDAQKHTILGPETSDQTELGSPKLRWTGKKNVLYYLFAQCLQPPSGKSYLEPANVMHVARFIKAHIEGVDASVDTINKEISRYKNGDLKPPTKPITLP